MTDPNDASEPQPVQVANPEPIPVTVHQEPDEVVRAATAARVDAAADAIAAKTDAKTATVKAVAKVDADKLRTDDQRRISGIWERTQQIIALSVVWASLLVATIKSVEASMHDQPSTEAGVAFVFLASVANLVIGFYFGRTNHTRVGGMVRPEDDHTR